MDSEQILLTEDQLEYKLCASMYAGERCMAKGIENLILQQAARYFTLGKDELAHAFRNFAKTFHDTVVLEAVEKEIRWKNSNKG